jgi:ABC-2 type transport system ATP-binding protein
MDILTLKGINKSFNSHVALKNVDLSIPEGAISGLLGPNGAGKTTLLRIITQILLPDLGSVLFRGHRLRISDRFSFGYLPEERGLYRKMKVRDHLLFLASLKEVPAQEASRDVTYWLQQFEIEDRAGHRIEELSKGMQQKIQFIAALLHKPEVVILDEPFTGFDPINEETAQRVIKDLNQNGITFILSTHRMESVENYCTHTIFINKGEVVLQGAVGTIKEKFKENLFRVEGTGHLADDYKSFDLIKKRVEKDQLHAILKLRSGFVPNEMLSELMTTVNISGFKEEIPGIEYIFKKVIREGK